MTTVAWDGKRMAMHLGKSATEAVELTLLFDANSGGPVESMKLAEPFALKVVD